MSELFSRAFWIDTTERSLKTFAYSTVGALPVGAAAQSFAGVPWLDAALVGASAAVLSVLGSIASLKVGTSGTASLTKAVELVESSGTEA
jgi:hypothetical protein